MGSGGWGGGSEILGQGELSSSRCDGVEVHVLWSKASGRGGEKREAGANDISWRVELQLTTRSTSSSARKI